MKQIIGPIFLVSLCLTSSGCASFGKKFKAFLNGRSEEETAATRMDQTPRASTHSDYLPSLQRKYKRATRKSLEDEAELQGSSGSLWVMEGQGSYLFAQNIMRMIGDPLMVRVEGEAQSQLSSKTQVIKKLLAKLESRKAAYERSLAAEKEGGAPQKPPEEKESGKPAETAAQTQKEQQLPEGFDVKSVPTRVVERLVDGNYRVKGSQNFMIGPREYKVIVTGIVRAEDFSDEGTPSSKLIDAKFDIVTSKKREEEI